MTEPSASTGRSPGKTIAQMSAMMFLQYWSLGLWSVTAMTFIAMNTGSEGEQIFSSGFIGYSGAAAAIGSLVAPTLFGWIADRFFSAERLLSLLHVGAAGALYLMYQAESQTGYFLALLAYFQFYSPTVSLTNTIALARLDNRKREFPIVRMYGTVAWVAAGVFIGTICRQWLGESIESTRTPFAIAGWSHLAMTAYALTLPLSRPRLKESATAITAAIPRWCPSRRLIWFLVLSLAASAMSQTYSLAIVFLTKEGYIDAAATLTLGQLGEIVCLLSMGWLFTKLRLKTLFLIGVLCWTARYMLLAVGSLDWLGAGATACVFAAILVHGPAYLFVFLIGQLYVDKMVNSAHRGVAQGLHTLATSGIGNLLGAGMTGWAQSAFLTPEGVDPPPYHWAPFWLTPVVLGLVVAVVFATRFAHEEEPANTEDEPSLPSVTPDQNPL